MDKVHKTAEVASGAQVAEDVTIGPYSIISEDAKIGPGTTIGPHVLIEGRVEIGEGNEIHKGAVIGTPPQDWSYEDSDTGVKIGDNNVLREYITINCPTSEDTDTVVGSDNMIMAYCHIAHDCKVGDGNALANGVTLAGHVTVGNNVVMGGLTPVHQFVRIGSYAMVGGLSRLNKDVPLFIRISGNPAEIIDVNSIGLRRNDFSVETRKILKRAFKIIFRSNNNTSQALEQIVDELPENDQLEKLLEFIENSERGIHK